MKPFIVGLALVVGSALPVSAGNHQVTIQGMAFQPSALQVAIGDTVTFTNAGPAAHTATATGGAFDTGRIRSGEAVRVAITEAGTLDFICDYHPSMRGRIVAN